MKSGFTLVELLAVIVILAVLALIATPVVLSIIDDAKESAMLRSAEMYLSGVENAVMRENMNSGGNFRPSECTITNGNMTCDSTNVEVEVDGEVPSTGTIVFENGKIKEVTLNYESGTIIKDNSGNLVYEGIQKYTAYVVGDELTIGTEHFYVISNSDETQENIILLAKDCIVVDESSTDYLKQSASAGKIAFSSINYWSSETDYNLDLNDYPIPEGVTSVITIAKKYGEKTGGTGRLMTYDEANALLTNYNDLIAGINGKSSSEYLEYFLATIDDPAFVTRIEVEYWGLDDIDYLVSTTNVHYGDMYSVRPVVEISKSKL